jgi:hypothetical protein
MTAKRTSSTTRATRPGLPAVPGRPPPARVPGKGMINIFNRSHYEDVLVVRVKGLVPETVWRPRYEAINQFEYALTPADPLCRVGYTLPRQ